MIDKKIINLINKSIDGLLSEKEKQELDSYLKDNKEALEYIRNHEKLSIILEQVPVHEVPKFVKNNIMDTIRIRSQNREVSPMSKYNLSEYMKNIFQPRSSIAFALGVVTCMIFIWAFGGEMGLMNEFKQRYLAGSMICDEYICDFSPSDTDEFSFGNNRGSLKTGLSDGQLALDIMMEVSEEAEIKLVYDDDILALQSISEDRTSYGSMEVTNVGINILTGGDSRYAFIFEPIESEDAVIKVLFSSSGESFEKSINCSEILNEIESGEN